VGFVTIKQQQTRQKTTATKSNEEIFKITTTGIFELFRQKRADA